MSSSISFKQFSSKEYIPQTFLENPKILKYQPQSSHQINWEKILSIKHNNYQSIKPHLQEILNIKLTKQNINDLPEHYVLHLVKIIQTINSIHIQSKQNETNYFRKTHHHKNKSALINNGKPREYIHTFKCEYCSGVFFRSHIDLNAHIQRRHLILNKQIHNNRENKKSQMQLHRQSSAQIINNNNIHNNKLINNIRNEYKSFQSRINNLETTLYQSYNTNNNLNLKKDYIPSEKVVGNNITYNISNSETHNKNKNDVLVNSIIEDFSEKIIKNSKESDMKFKELLNEMAKFKLSISSEISNFKQDQSFSRALNFFLNQTDISQSYITSTTYKHRKQRKHHSVKHPKEKNSELIEEISNRSASKQKQQFQNNDIISISNTHLELKATCPNNHYTNQTYFHFNNNSPQKELVISSQVINESISDINCSPNQIYKFKDKSKHIDINKNKLYDFFTRFKKRDGNLNGNFRSYLQKLIPETYMLNNSYIHNKINLLSNARMKAITNNRINSIQGCQFLSKNDLIKLLKKIYENVGDRSTFNDFYGYYSKNLDFVFNTKGLIDEANDIYYGETSEKKIIEKTRMNYGSGCDGVFDVINYNVIHSGSFSFKEKDDE